jgi:hypothetical protein
LGEVVESNVFAVFPALANQLLQLPTGDTVTQILSMLFYVVFIVFLFYGQRIQMYVMIREVEGSLHKLKYMRDEGRKTAIETIKEIGKPQTDPSDRVDRYLDYFVTMPQSMDPAGIVWKLDHIIDVRDARLKDEVKLMAPASDENQVDDLENTLGWAMALNYYYKVVRHFYIQGKKTLSIYSIMQLQMILPLVMKEAEGYANALKASVEGQPIGDGAGALLAAKLMHGYETKKLPKDCVVSTVPMEGRTTFVIKAEGPGGNVGRPGDAVKAVISENEGKIAAVIMIDAALKLEGEVVGEITEGIGSAIGGEGVDQFKIEEAIAQYHIPIHAVTVKEDIGDALSPMRKEISDAIDKAIGRVKGVISERTKEGDKVIIVGVGNTIGIGQ